MLTIRPLGHQSVAEMLTQWLDWQVAGKPSLYRFLLKIRLGGIESGESGIIERNQPGACMTEMLKILLLHQWQAGKLSLYRYPLFTGICGLLDDDEMKLGHLYSPVSIGWFSCRALSQHSTQIFFGACRRCSSKAPGVAASAGITSPGNNGLALVPIPALPPEFICTCGPTSDTPLGSILRKLPPALAVSSMPASMTSLVPA